MAVKKLPENKQMPHSKEEHEKAKQEKAVQTKLKEIVNKRKDAKIEFGYTLDLDGNVIAMNRGGKGSCQITDCYNRIGVHNHPAREGDAIGGTFSPADIMSMYLTNRPVNYAFDKEYIYELRAINWSHMDENSLRFNSDRLLKAIDIKQKYNEFVRNAEIKAYNNAKKLKDDGRFRKADGSTDWRHFEQYYVRNWFQQMNIWLKNHSKEFGYEYHVHSIRSGK